jgi:hypothetical protein
MSGRVQSTTTGGGLEIRVKAESIGVTAIFLLAWLTGWTAGGFFAIKQVIKMITEGAKDLGGVVFLCAWLVGWAFGEVMVIFTLLWSLVGEEIISLNEGVLQIKMSVLGLGRSRQFQSMLIQNLRMTDFTQPLHRSRKFGGFKPGSVGAVSIDYEGVTYRFGMGLTEAEARQVIDQLAVFLPYAAQRPAEQKSF